MTKAKAKKVAKKATPEKAKKTVPTTLQSLVALGKNPAFIELMEKHELIDENKKQCTKAQGDIRARAKEEMCVSSKVFMLQVAMRKLDPDVRKQVEQGIMDTNVMLGYQFALALVTPSGKPPASNGGGNAEVKADSTPDTTGTSKLFKPVKPPQVREEDDEQAAGAVHH